MFQDINISIQKISNPLHKDTRCAFALDILFTDKYISFSCVLIRAPIYIILESELCIKYYNIFFNEAVNFDANTFVFMTSFAQEHQRINKRGRACECSNIEAYATVPVNS